MSRLDVIADYVASLIWQRKKISLIELARLAGYNPTYFRYNILPVVESKYPQIKRVKIGGAWFIVYDEGGAASSITQPGPESGGVDPGLLDDVARIMCVKMSGFHLPLEAWVKEVSRRLHRRVPVEAVQQLLVREDDSGLYSVNPVECRRRGWDVKQ